jgi:hypothetical protein
MHNRTLAYPFCLAYSAALPGSRAATAATTTSERRFAGHINAYVATCVSDNPNQNLEHQGPIMQVALGSFVSYLRSSNDSNSDCSVVLFHFSQAHKTLESVQPVKLKDGLPKIHTVSDVWLLVGPGLSRTGNKKDLKKDRVQRPSGLEKRCPQPVL